ncbi:matrixin family metalloprotease [Burkholderia gladioli]|uniref:matrixin family metalloprotease n=1 Tax=Burkholderia gladioli TaxID=28095 RepID=UPI003C7E106D
MQTYANLPTGVSSVEGEFSGMDGTGTEISEIDNYTSGGSAETDFTGLADGVASEHDLFTGIDGTGAETARIIDFTDGGSQEQVLTGLPSNITSQVDDFTGADASGTETSIMTDYQVGTSSLQILSGLANGVASETEDFSGPDGTGSAEETLINFTSGESEAQLYNGGGELPAGVSQVDIDYAGTNETGDELQRTTDFISGGSQVEITTGLLYGLKSSVENFTGADGSGAMTQADYVFATGGTESVTFADLPSGISSIEELSTGPDGSGIDTETINYTAGGSEVRLLSSIPTGDTSFTEEFSGASGSGQLLSATITDNRGLKEDFDYNYDQHGVETSYDVTVIDSNGNPVTSVPFAPNGEYYGGGSGNTEAVYWFGYTGSVGFAGDQSDGFEGDGIAGGYGGDGGIGGEIGAGGPDGNDWGGVWGIPDGGDPFEITSSDGDWDGTDPDIGDLVDVGGFGFAGDQSVVTASLDGLNNLTAITALQQPGTGGSDAVDSALHQAATAAETNPETDTGASEFEGINWHSPIVTWSLGSNSGNDSTLFSSDMSSQYDADVQAAFATWAAVSGITFEEVPNNTPAEIRVGWDNFDTLTTGVVGYTSIQSQPGENPLAAMVRLEDPTRDALIDNADGDQTYTGTDATLSQVLLHEIGHALGLADNSDPHSVMYYELTSENRTLDDTDISGIQSLYGFVGTGITANGNSAKADSDAIINRQLAQLIGSMAASGQPPSLDASSISRESAEHQLIAAGSQ